MKVLVIANLGNKSIESNGQTIKSIELIEFFKNKKITYTTENTATWKLFNIFFKLVILFFKYLKSDKVIIVPARNALKVQSIYLRIVRLFAKKDIYYIVIGAWLAEVVRKNRKIYKFLKIVKGIYVETKLLQSELIDLGLSNSKVLYNFKSISNLGDIELSHPRFLNKPYKICTFSRVKEKKGILDIINVVNQINKEFNDKVYVLDVYGPIEKEFEEKFYLNLNEDIIYQGELSQEQILKTLSKYFLLVFPTKYYTEGLPGTLIDAYLCGLPVVASKWGAAHEFINDSTGFIYEMGDLEQLKQILISLAKNPKIVENMRQNCIRESKKYYSENVMNKFLQDLQCEDFIL